MKTMELGVCSTFFLEQIHGEAAGVGCVWRRKFGVELFYWIWSCVELSQTRPKYYPNSSFWTSPTSGPKSIFWSSVLQVQHHLSENSILQIHAGNSSIWSSPWMTSWSTIHDHILLPVTNTPLPAKNSDLWL
jgi:hypothetical protein